VRSMLTFLVFLALAGRALAVDGVLEINQTCAVQTGCFSGDTAGYPVTIDGMAGGSYRLTSNLIVPDENTNGIQVSTASITIDLNGFEIVRSGCEDGTNCTSASGTGSGVVTTSALDRGLSVKNGSVTGMGSNGVSAGPQCEVSGLRVRWNRIYGIFAGPGSIVSGNIAYQNGSTGILANGGSTVSGNTASFNGGIGISAGFSSTVSGNTVVNNGDDGISAGFSSTVSGNTAYANGSDGIFASTGSTVQRNTVNSNIGFGLNLLSPAAYRENVINLNMGGTVSGGVNMFSNSCNGTTTCP
jgi:parallel beta-helix repeat protein